MNAFSNLLISTCWIIFIVYWLLNMRGTKPIAEHQGRLSFLVHRVPLALGGILLWCPIFPYPLNIPLPTSGLLTRPFGALACLLGLCVAIWSRRTLGGNWSGTVTFKRNHELITTGPYHYVRHPIYTGILLMCWGSAIDISQLHAWLGLLVMCMGMWIKLKQEETLLLRYFPDQYPAYRTKVKAIVPFLI